MRRPKPFPKGGIGVKLSPPILKITAHKAQQSGAPVYSYVMTYGATHGAEIPLAFRASAPDNAEPDALQWLAGLGY